MNVQDEWTEWTRERDRAITADYGPLSLTALHWLTDTPTAYPPVPGMWRADAKSITVTDAENLRFDDHAIADTVTLTADTDVRGEFDRRRVVEVIRRDGAAAIRVRDPQAPARLAFGAQPRYAFDPAWRLTGAFAPYEQPRVSTVGSVVEGVSHRMLAAGDVRFTVGADEHRLVVFTDVSHSHRWILFSSRTTPVSIRSLVPSPPDKNGDMVVDFNRAQNLPCAYNDFSTCPVPPPENRLEIEVTAGERLPNASLRPMIERTPRCAAIA